MASSRAVPKAVLRWIRANEDGDEPPRQTQSISRDDLTPGQSVLHERKDPTLYQEMTFVGPAVRCHSTVSRMEHGTEQ